MQLSAPALVALQSHPDTIAIRCGQEQISYRDLFGLAQTRALALIALKHRPGTSIPLRATSGLDFVVLLHGCWLAGLQPVLHPTAGMAPAEVTSMQETDTSVPVHRWTMEEDFVAVFTSGSTGTPRRCVLSYGHFILQALGSAAKAGAVPGDTWLNPLPAHTIGSLAILVRCCLLGLTVELAQPFDAGQAQQRLASSEVQLASMVPVMLDQILALNPDVDYPTQLRAVICGGAALPQSTATRARKQGIKTIPAWGMSESGAMIAARSAQDHAPPDACGYPLPFVDLQESPDGRLQFRMPWQQAWQQTNDFGYRDDAGAVHITGRADDVILSGAQNLDPIEIESALLQHDQIQQTVVFAVPDATWGQRPWALVKTTKDSSTLTETEIQQWLQTQLPRRKVPDRINFVPEIPRTPAGKISRSQIAQMWPPEKSS